MDDRHFAGKTGELTTVEFAQDYVSRLINLLGRIDLPAVADVIDLFREARNKGNTLFFLGNGGSAATAEHFANDLAMTASPHGAIPFRAISLASNVALLSCIANDFGYEEVFYRQLRNLMRPGDVVVGISASGNSLNAIKALEYAASNGATPVAIVGFDGGRMKHMAKHVIHIENRPGDYGPVEDIHIVLDHLITQYFATIRTRKT